MAATTVGFALGASADGATGEVRGGRIDLMLGSAIIGLHVLLMGLCLMHALR